MIDICGYGTYELPLNHFTVLTVIIVILVVFHGRHRRPVKRSESFDSVFSAAHPAAL